MRRARKKPVRVNAYRLGEQSEGLDRLIKEGLVSQSDDGTFEVHTMETKDEKGESWTFDFPDGKDRVIEIPENDYQIVSFNYDTEGIAWGNSERFADFTAGTREASSPEGVLMYTTPSWLCGDDLSDVAQPSSPKAPILWRCWR